MTLLIFLFIVILVLLAALIVLANHSLLGAKVDSAVNASEKRILDKIESMIPVAAPVPAPVTLKPSQATQAGVAPIT